MTDSPADTDARAAHGARLTSRDAAGLCGLLPLLLGLFWLAMRPTAQPFPPIPDDVRLRVDVNSAGIPELMLLEGIGEKTAQKIIDDRDARGPFRTPGDLSRVSGIGPKTVENLTGRVRFGISDSDTSDVAATPAAR